MLNISSVAASLFFIVIAPTLIHLSGLRGAEFYPAKRPKNQFISFLIYQAAKPILLLNGLTLCSTYLLWKYVEGNWWVVSIGLTIPGIVTQLIVLVIAKHSDVLNS